MKLHGLSWRIGLPFLLLVLSFTLTLALFLREQIVAQDQQRIERLASANAAFIDQASLPLSERLAGELTRVTGCDVYFRRGTRLTPAPSDAALGTQLLQAKANAKVQAAGIMQVVVVPLPEDSELVLVHQPDTQLFDPRILQVVIAFWVLALLLAWLVVRGLVRPLRNLASQVRNIEQPEALILPETDRHDEIGDVARAMAHTHATLHGEREQRARMEKLAILGRMTTSLAHEIRNPIAAIKMHAQLWRNRETTEAPDVIEGEADRIEALINQWMFLSRPDPPAFTTADIGELLDQTLRSQSAQMQHAGVTVTVHKHGVLTARCDRQRLQHVLHNLCTNAMQAMPHGGELIVTANGEGSKLELVFTDSGPGFSSEARTRYAEYFFSEKEGGMGIGLSVAQEIVAAHHGELHIDNPKGFGARVRLLLPKVEAAS